MILQALVKRYEDAQDIPAGWQWREAHYALEIDENGQLLGVIGLGTDDEKKRGRLPLILPSIGSGRSGKKAYETAYFLCDDGNYFLGLDPLKYGSAQKLHTALLKDVNTPAARAILAYFAAPPQTLPPGYEDKADANAKYVFSVNGRRVDYQDGGEQIRRAWEAAQSTDAEDIRCLVTGRSDAVIKLHDKVSLMGVTMGAQPLISMNDQTSFRSYGDKPGDPPARIGQHAAFAYVTALNALLKDEHHRKRLGGDTLVYWAEEGGEPEASAFSWVGDPKEEDGQMLGALMEKYSRGVKLEIENCDMERPFYLLCLSPNAGRISVRFFYQSSFEDTMKNNLAHYRDLEIVTSPNEKFRYLPPWILLAETTVKNQAGDVAPLLGGQLMYSILSGGPYPLTLYDAILARIRAGKEINRAKAAIIKAVLIRNFTYGEREGITVALNEQSKDKPYVLGRLFAVLEWIQQRSADGQLNATIRDRYFTSACANPGSAFPTLLRLSMHHIAKLDKPGYFEKLKGTLIDKLDAAAPFPAALSLEAQGQFIVGYYHQIQDFYTSKKDKEEPSNV